MISDDLDSGLFFQARPCAFKNAIFLMVFILHEWFFLCCARQSVTVPLCPAQQRCAYFTHFAETPHVMKVKRQARKGKANKEERLLQNYSDCTTTKKKNVVEGSLHEKLFPWSMLATMWRSRVQRWSVIIVIFLCSPWSEAWQDLTQNKQTKTSLLLYVEVKNHANKQNSLK